MVASNENEESENEDKKDPDSQDETVAGLDSDYDIDEYKLDEQLMDTDNDLQHQINITIDDGKLKAIVSEQTK